MKIYVGRWNLLPESWEGYKGLINASEKEIENEIKFQQDDIGNADDFIGVYDEQEFEDTFNLSIPEFISSRDYWIKIF